MPVFQRKKLWNVRLVTGDIQDTSWLNFNVFYRVHQNWFYQPFSKFWNHFHYKLFVIRIYGLGNWGLYKNNQRNRGGFKNNKTVNLGLWPKLGGGSGPVWRAQLSLLVIRNVKTTSHFLIVTPLIWAIEGQNNESKTNKGLISEGGVWSDKFWPKAQIYRFFFWSIP